MSMNKKRAFVLLFLSALLITGLFGSPSQGVSAESPTERYVSIGWILPPPETVCKGDSVPVMFIYMVMNYTQAPGGGVTAVPGDDPANTILHASTMSTTAGGSGTVSPYKWMPSFLQSSGRISATYTAKKTGGDQITIFGTGVLPEGATTEYFQVVNCAYDFSIGGSVYVDDPHTKIDTEFHGKGIVSIDENGLVMGEGTYQYNIGIEYIPPDSIICDRVLKSTNDSTFQVTGTASVDYVYYDFKFYPVEIKPAVAHCVDREGKTIERELFPGGPIDISSEIQVSGGFGTSKSQVHVTLPFGTGTLDYWFVKRKAK
jgi:hypothetical protein